MYAIIRAGGKQAKVQVGDVLEIERVKDVGESLSFRSPSRRSRRRLGRFRPFRVGQRPGHR